MKNNAQSVQKEPLVAIILLNWNQEDDTSECLESLKRIDYSNYSIIVVDNYSTDGSYEALTRQFPSVDFIRNEENLGFAGGMNKGIEYALDKHVEYVMILNSDTFVSPQLLCKLVDVYKTDNSIGIAGPIIYNYYKPRELDFAGGVVDLTLGRIKHIKKIKNNDRPFDSDYMTGCCMLIPAEILQKYGAFDPAFFVLCEDLDLSLRLRREGCRIVCHPQAVVWHKISTSLNKQAGYYFWFRNILLILKRHGKLPARWCAYSKILLGNFAKCLLFSILAGRTGEIKALFWGVSDFIKGNFNKGRLEQIIR